MDEVNLGSVRIKESVKMSSLFTDRSLASL